MTLSATGTDGIVPTGPFFEVASKMHPRPGNGPKSGAELGRRRRLEAGSLPTIPERRAPVDHIAAPVRIQGRAGYGSTNTTADRSTRCNSTLVARYRHLEEGALINRRHRPCIAPMKDRCGSQSRSSACPPFRVHGVCTQAYRPCLRNAYRDCMRRRLDARQGQEARGSCPACRNELTWTPDG